MQKTKYYCDKCGKECAESTIRKLILDNKDTKEISFCERIDLCKKCFINFEKEKGKLKQYFILNSNKKYYANF